LKAPKPDPRKKKLKCPSMNSQKSRRRLDGQKPL
jgi:hypothetical protein